MRKLVYYIATSIDGFIADPHGNYGDFPLDPGTLEALFEMYPETKPTHIRDGKEAAARRFDTVLMGYRTFEPAIRAGLPGGAYAHLRQLVVTHRALAADGVEVIGGDVAERIQTLKAAPGMDIWLCGGADLAGGLIDLIDEIQLKIYPVVFGEGVPLVRGTYHPQAFRLIDSRALPGGVVLTTYRR